MMNQPQTRGRFLLMLVCAALCCFANSLVRAQGNHTGYLHANGVTMLDVSNNPIVLRGVNLGSWLWPEYYMMGNVNLAAYGNAGTGTGGINNYYDGFVAAIQDLMNGDTNLTAQLLDAYWTNYINVRDIAFLHSQGFNTVRVPFDFEEFFQVTNWANNYPTNGYDISTGFKYFDNLLAWCSTNGIYVIPDFHCPPGGPNNYSVTNYGGTANTNTASVFANPANLALTAHIWSRIAARYATNPTIGGYDLLNEPVNTSVTSSGGQVGSPTLANTFSNLVKAIRLVDTNHLLLCEGDYYASTLWDVDNTGWPDPAANLAFSDHDYGSTLPLGTGNRSTSVGANVPDWAGEFGINSTRWYNQIIANTYEHPKQLTANGHMSTILEGHCFWAYKSTQFYTVVENPQTAGWNALKAYWASGNAPPKPDVTNAYNWLLGYFQAANFTNCLVHPEIVDSLMRPSLSTNSTGFSQKGIPYKNGVTIPGKIFAVDYDMGDSNVTYLDTASVDEVNQGPGGSAWNNGWYGRDDGVDTITCTDPGTLLKVGWNDAGEWQRHTVLCTPGTYDLYIRYAGGASGGQISISMMLLSFANNSVVLSSNNISGIVDLPAPYGSYMTYSTCVVSNVVVTNSGLATLQVNVVSPGYDLAWIEFTPSGGPPLPPTGQTIIGAQPGTPAGLSAGVAAVAGNREVSLNWVASENALRYNVKRATRSAGPYTNIASCTALSYLDNGLANGTAYYYAVSAVNAAGESANSSAASATPVATSLPSPWVDQDVGVANLWSGDAGDVGWQGSAVYASGQYSVAGSGIDIWSQADSFHYMYCSSTGDSTNVVRVVSVGNTDPWAKAGLMIRESFNPDSLNVMMAMTSQNGALFSYRNSTGGASSSAGHTGVSAPYWVKLVRIGNIFTGCISSNGSTWTQVGSATMPMARNVFVGPAVTAHNNIAVNTSVFDNLSAISQVAPPPVSLKVTPSGGNVMLSWPGSATGFTLEGTTSLGAPSKWLPVTNQAMLQGSSWNVVLPAGGAGQFFRLASP